VNIRELDEESRRTGVWPPRRIILRVERGSSHIEEPEHEAPVSVGLVDLASPSRPTVRTSARSRHAAPSIAPERLAAGQVAPRPPLSRPPAPGSVVRRNGRIIAAPRPTSRLRDEDAEFERWLAMPLAISDSDPDYQEAPVWLPEDRRLRAERRHRRIARRTRAQLFGTSAVTTIAAAGCCVALAAVLSQTETVGGSLGVPSIGLFGTRPAPSPQPAEPAARASRPAPKTSARKPAKRTARTARSSPSSSSSSSSSRSNQVASANNPASTSTRSSTPTPQRTVTPPPPPAAPRQVTKPKASTPAKTTSPKPVQAPPANSSPSSSGSPSLGSDGEPSL
jgi:hypothetical protein